jgi:hypothetical protein
MLPALCSPNCRLPDQIMHLSSQPVDENWVTEMQHI